MPIGSAGDLSYFHRETYGDSMFVLGEMDEMGFSGRLDGGQEKGLASSTVDRAALESGKPG